MYREQYNRTLKDVLKKCKANPQEDYSNIIEDMQKYKPQTLMWDVANAWNQWNKNKDPQQVLDLMNNKYCLHRIYPGLKECIELLEVVYEAKNDYQDADKIRCAQKLLEEDFDEYYKLQELCKRALNQELAEEEEIGDQAYKLGDNIGYLFNKIEDISAEKLDNITNSKIYVEALKEKNITYLFEEIISDPDAIFVLVENEENQDYMQYIYRKLVTCAKHVYYLKTPLQCSYEGIEIQDTLQISLENANKTEYGVEFIPIEFVFDNGDTVDNRDYIIRLISNLYYQGKRLLHVIGSGYMIDDLSIRPLIQKEVSRITPYKYDIYESNLCCCIYGNYLEYISKIYGEDCQELVDKKPSKKFSIVIPARNSAETLRYTLQTCLEQRYLGDYEILISDNSTEGNLAVKNLIEEIKDNKIVYIKTPKELELSKSFEYAYLHASGEYIIPIGSDDGVLPWALEVLDYITSKYPEEYIIQWERGFYAWPEFNEGQQNQFIIPRKYEKYKLNLYYRESKDYIEAFRNNSQSMYGFPLLYINSCFKREYFKILLNKTGRLWDGACQDLYIGVYNICINSKIMNCLYPLTIAGMSNRSIGANNDTPSTTKEQVEYKETILTINSRGGGFCYSYYDRMMNCFAMDIDGAYGCFLRAYNNGVLKELFFDWKLVYEKIRKKQNLLDVYFEKKIENTRNSAKMQGREFLSWFDDTFYAVINDIYVIATKVQNEDIYKHSYTIGENDLGGKTLDASEYEVKNIYDAVKLFERLTSL